MAIKVISAETATWAAGADPAGQSITIPSDATAVYMPWSLNADSLDFPGLQIIENASLVIRTQVCFPRTKKKRIQKKWAKRPENWRTDIDTMCYRVGDTLIVHPVVARQLRRELDKTG